MSLPLKGRCESLFPRGFQCFVSFVLLFICGLQAFHRNSNPISIVTPYSPFFPLPVCTVDGVFFHNTFTPNHHNSSCHVFQ